LFFLGGFIVELYLAGTVEAVQFGFSLLLWGAIVRTVVVWHITWSVNSVAHLWGYRNFATDDRSRNNFCLGIIASGEGWHNNHHADPRAAKHGHHWWEIDDTYIIIRFLVMLGLARNVIMPNAASTAAGANDLATRAYAEMPHD
jgi:stearoyl-CoA desaturase (delta-9 desaturase)